MIPGGSLSNPTEYALFIPPDGLTQAPNTIDYELGGIGIDDPSQGLEYQFWTLQILGTNASTYLSLSAPNTTAITVLSAPYISQCSLAFDQNMRPSIAYVAQDDPYFYWYDATVPGYTTMSLGSDITTPRVTMDDKRAMATRLGTNDVILTYVATNNLYYRQQRDRYTIEYLLQLSIPTPAPYLVKVGMNENFRLQWYFHGSVY